MRDWHEREAMNEVESRRRNEWIEETIVSFGGLEPMDDYVCECSDLLCRIMITLSRDEYESVRKYGTHFAIAIDHENPEIDRVIGQNGRFAIVEKWLNPGRRVANESNPRV
jgi:hypothetical protein